MSVEGEQLAGPQHKANFAAPKTHTTHEPTGVEHSRMPSPSTLGEG
jgi:hypothetical protein